MEYTYDGLNRLTGAYDTKNGKNWEYGYDENGNITYETVNGVKNVYTYAKFDAAISAGAEIISETSQRKNIDWKRVGIQAVGGAASGALMGSGSGFAAGIFGGAGVRAVEKHTAKVLTNVCFNDGFFLEDVIHKLEDKVIVAAMKTSVLKTVFSTGIITQTPLTGWMSEYLCWRR
ncbi:MAG: hypothetical protein K6F39_03735 [Lachnospiraceae bacterium]|nr:hypothetical protein [Lachnospiraceae bacterium]